MPTHSPNSPPFWPTTFHVPLRFATAADPFAKANGIAGALREGPQDPTTTSDQPGGQPAGPGGATTAPGEPNAGGPQGAPPQQACGSETFLIMGAMLAAMYFLVMRPEQKRRKEQQALLASVKQGDRVVTVSGMHGVVARLTDKTVTLRVDAVQITFDRVAIARIERDEPSAAPAKT